MSDRERAGQVFDNDIIFQSNIAVLCGPRRCGKTRMILRLVELDPETTSAMDARTTQYYYQFATTHISSIVRAAQSRATLIVVQPDAIPHWRAEARKWIPDATINVLDKTTTNFSIMSRCICLIDRDLINRVPLTISWNRVVFDDAESIPADSSLQRTIHGRFTWLVGTATSIDKYKCFAGEFALCQIHPVQNIVHIEWKCNPLPMSTDPINALAPFEAQRQSSWYLPASGEAGAREFLSALRRETHTQSRQTARPPVRTSACAICQDNVIDAVYLTTCGHVFCARCIVAWLARKNTCPCCRTRSPDMSVCKTTGETASALSMSLCCCGVTGRDRYVRPAPKTQYLPVVLDRLLTDKTKRALLVLDSAYYAVRDVSNRENTMTLTRANCAAMIAMPGSLAIRADVVVLCASSIDALGRLHALAEHVMRDMSFDAAMSSIVVHAVIVQDRS